MNVYKGPDFLFKTIFIGNAGVGKTCLSRVLSGSKYDPSCSLTIVCDFLYKTFEVDGKSVKLQIWDTAGQEKYRSISRPYYKGAHGVVLVYDLFDRKSFEDIEGWINDAKQFLGNQSTMILIGNKCDLEGQRMVSKEEGEQFAQKFGMKFFETSAKTQRGLDDAFKILSKDMKESKEKEEEGQVVGADQGLKTEPIQKKGFFKFCSVQ